MTLLGTRKSSPAFPEALDTFFEKTPVDPSWELEDKTDTIYDFVANHVRRRGGLGRSSGIMVERRLFIT